MNNNKKKLITEAVPSTYEEVANKINNQLNTEGKRIMENNTTFY